MTAFVPPPSPAAVPLSGKAPVLHLSGEALTQAFTALIEGAEALGGIERYVHALKLKADLFREALADGAVARLEIDSFKGLCTFMSPVRRRIAPYLDTAGFAKVKDAMVALLGGMSQTAQTDQRIKAFCRAFPQDRQHNFVRDLAAELLHYTDPERYPLMCRWVWDASTNTGALREVWFGDDVDHMIIDVPDGYDSFLVLRQELSTFLAENGVFRDTLFYMDLICAQVYSHYICAQGGTYLRTDFASPQDPMQYTRRLLGLDGVEPKSGRTRLKSIDGSAFVLADDTRLLG